MQLVWGADRHGLAQHSAVSLGLPVGYPFYTTRLRRQSQAQPLKIVLGRRKAEPFRTVLRQSRQTNPLAPLRGSAIMPCPQGTPRALCRRPLRGQKQKGRL